MGDAARGGNDKKIVLVTGFGPFGNHKINASWEAVKELEKLGLDHSDYRLVKREIPVTYKAVKSEVPRLWKDLKPHLVVHVGVSDIAHDLTLENLAHNDGFIKCDADGEMNDTSFCCVGGADRLHTGLDMSEVCDYVNKRKCPIVAVTSTDPGRFLCDFIYYTSLMQDNSRAAFIHVPPLDRFSASAIAEGIRVAIDGMLCQLK